MKYVTSKLLLLLFTLNIIKIETKINSDKIKIPELCLNLKIYSWSTENILINCNDKLLNSKNTLYNSTIAIYELNDIKKNENFLVVVNSQNKSDILFKNGTKHEYKFNFKPKLMLNYLNDSYSIDIENNLWLTEIENLNWSKIDSNVESIEFFLSNVYYLRNDRKLFNLKNKQIIHENVIQLKVYNKFMFYVTSTMDLFMSQNGRDFKQVPLPSTNHNDDRVSIKNYNFLDESHGDAFIAIDYLEGKLFYEQKLFRSHDLGHLIDTKMKLFKKNDDGVFDFYKVPNDLGILIANMDDGKSYISFDNGHRWIELKFDAKDNDKSFNLISDIYAPKSYPGFFVANAKSNNGDYAFFRWNGVNELKEILSGNYHVKFGNNGALMIAVEKNTKTNKLKYSINSGKTYKSIDFNDEMLNIKSIKKLTELEFLIHGEDSLNNLTYLIPIDFRSIFNKNCSNDDYEIKILTNNGTCILGEELKFKKIKDDHTCISFDDKTEVLHRKSCYCTSYDYHCDLGFFMSNDQSDFMDCTLDYHVIKKMNYDPYTPKSCKVNQEYWYRTKKFRKIPGSKCIVNKHDNEHLLRYEYEMVPCKERQEFVLILSDKKLKQHYITDHEDDHFEDIFNFDYPVVSFDYDYETNLLFWSTGNSIKKRLFEKNSKIEAILNLNGNVNDLNVDWLGRNLYWINNNESSSIQIASFNGSSKLTILSSLNRPQSLILDPNMGYMYFTESNLTHSRIIKATLNGSSQKIITELKLSKFNLLRLDYDGYLYWNTDDKIYFLHTNGTIIKYLDLKVNGFGISKDKLYYFKSESNTFERKWRLDFHDDEMYALHLNRVEYFKIYHKSSQSYGNVQCKFKNTCTNLCISMPHESKICLCPNGTCLDEKVPLLCGDNQFECINSGECIEITLLCNNISNCKDGSDELDCESLSTTSQPIKINTSESTRIQLSSKMISKTDASTRINSNKLANTKHESRMNSYLIIISIATILFSIICIAIFLILKRYHCKRSSKKRPQTDNHQADLLDITNQDRVQVRNSVVFLKELIGFKRDGRTEFEPLINS